ncbi:MAG TPA: DNA primase [Candidatus Saccharimonadales bacterium]|nr:DNA primase [Candidatus Saccharimonadales bacterium]
MDAVEDIKGRLAIEDVVGEYLELKRAGRNWRGLSPFNSEKTPSFMVSPEKQIWHDFSSNKGGNMFSFVMEMEGLDFKGALELLARKAGINLSDYQNSNTRDQSQLKERLFSVLELATKFYQIQFSKNRQALEYILKTRQFSKQTALEWKIGYSPADGTSLGDFLRRQKISDQDIKQAGLSTAYGGRKPQDMFRGRVMFPLQDPFGRVIGFTARLFSESASGPKYINTPQTILYDKSRHVFGLHLAKEAIRKNNFVVLTEGNLDVITSHQLGVRQVVATAGTAMTEQNLKALRRFTSDVRLCFDSDDAGVAATIRAIPIASKVDVSLSVIDLKDAKDPDELIKKNSEAWEKAINQPEYAVDWIIKHYQQKFDITSAQGKKMYSDTIIPIIKNLNDQIEQEHYIKKIARLLDVSQDALESKMQLGNKPTHRYKAHQTSPDADTDNLETIKAQDRLLALTLMQPKLRDFILPMKQEMLPSADARKFLQFLKANPDFAGDVNALPALQTLADYVKILSLQYETLYQDIDILELRYEAARLQTRLIEHYVKNQKRQLVIEMQSANETKTDTLLEKVKNLDKLLNNTREA